MDAAAALDLLAQMDADNFSVPCFSESDLSASEYSNDGDVSWELSATSEDNVDVDKEEDVRGGCDSGDEDDDGDDDDDGHARAGVNRERVSFRGPTRRGATTRHMDKVEVIMVQPPLSFIPCGTLLTRILK